MQLPFPRKTKSSSTTPLGKIAEKFAWFRSLVGFKEGCFPQAMDLEPE